MGKLTFRLSLSGKKIILAALSERDRLRPVRGISGGKFRVLENLGLSFKYNHSQTNVDYP